VTAAINIINRNHQQAWRKLGVPGAFSEATSAHLGSAASISKEKGALCVGNGNKRILCMAAKPAAAKVKLEMAINSSDIKRM